jgi:hypothetical protein
MLSKTPLRTNPFRIHGVADAHDFTDRVKELAKIRAILAEPGSKLLVYGERRMGKTSAITIALNAHCEQGGLGIIADFSTASTVADMATRILDAAMKSIGRRWRDVVTDVVGKLGLRVALEVDPTTGTPRASLDVALRDRPAEEQFQTLGQVLDALESVAAERGVHLAVVLDEFQEIHRFGGEKAEWQLRGIIQHHRHLTYVLSGSQPHLIGRMVGKGRAFYGLLDKLHFGAIERKHLAAWIDERNEAAGLHAPGLGEIAIDLAGPRTRDIIQLARKAFDVASANADAEALAAAAFREIVVEEDDMIRARWNAMTSHQQNVMRAIAAGEKGLSTRDTINRFSLRSSAAATQTARSFLEEGLIVAAKTPTGYGFDLPFMRAWVILHALPDIGITHPVTWQVRP